MAWEWEWPRVSSSRSKGATQLKEREGRRGKVAERWLGRRGGSILLLQLPPVVVYFP